MKFPFCLGANNFVPPCNSISHKTIFFRKKTFLSFTSAVHAAQRVRVDAATLLLQLGLVLLELGATASRPGLDHVSGVDVDLPLNYKIIYSSINNTFFGHRIVR